VEKVLVCLLAKTRAHELTFQNFKRQVLDELNGDLALALTIDEKYDYENPFWQHAKYRWTAPDFLDYGQAFDLAQRWLCQQHNVAAPDWRLMLKVKGIWQGGIQSADPQPSASSILPFCRWLLLQGLQQDGVLDRYDRFVITRSDFMWLCPHPPLSVLHRDAIWFPNGEHWGGLCDRHLVASRADVVNCLNVIEDILLHPLQLYEEMKGQSGWNSQQFLAHHFGCKHVLPHPIRLYAEGKPTWNNEQLLAHHLGRKGLLHKVKMFPYVMYSARPVRDRNPTWSRGRYEPAVGHYVKYENEYRAASAYATIIHGREDWEKGAWTEFDPTSVASQQVSLARRLRYFCERAYYVHVPQVVFALRRPGRIGRFVSFCMRILKRTIRSSAETP
jgi:hypothetical protein